MLPQCVFGARIEEPSSDIRFIETSWATWLTMYPESEVVSRNNTVYGYDYEDDPYPHYSVDNDMLFFPITYYDNRLPSKELVHALVIDNSARAYRMSSFPDDIVVMNDTFAGEPIVVAGSRTSELIVSFCRRQPDGQVLTFEAATDGLPAILIDDEGTTWDVFGTAVSGPRVGSSLPKLHSYNSYWFALASIYPGVELVEP
jgi:hypothetical protein